MGKQTNKKVSLLGVGTSVKEGGFFFSCLGIPRTCSMGELSTQSLAWNINKNVKIVDFSVYKFVKSNLDYKVLMYSCDLPLEHSMHDFWIRSGFTRVFDFMGNHRKRVYVYMRRSGK
jgi:hypothetical protein